MDEEQNNQTLNTSNLQQPEVTSPTDIQNEKSEDEVIDRLNVKKVSFFSKLFSGRINRKNYVLGWVLAFLIPLIITIFSVSLIKQIFGLLGIEITESFITLWGIMITMTHIFCAASVIIRRAHDIGKTWLYVIFFLIPIVNIITFFELLLRKGDEVRNKYGEPPEGNLDILRILAFK